MSIYTVVSGWFRYGGNALRDGKGEQGGAPTGNLIDDARAVGVDTALQISAVWAAVSLLAKTIATLPLFVYTNENGQRTLARDTSLWELLHENPNNRMTPSEFWTAMLLNLLLRGNAYARIVRDAKGDAFALWPMAADQVQMNITSDGRAVYIYRVGNDVAAYSEENVLHLKEMGNGSSGLSRLEYMRATTSEVANSQAAANKLFANGGKPSGVLMIDKVLSKDQRASLLARFSEMSVGNNSRLHVLEADMKFQQLNLSPEDLELLATRQLGIQEIGRWFGVPSILLNVTEGTTTLGSSSGEIIDSFYKLTIRPALVSIEQAIRKRVLTQRQRLQYTVEYSLDALLRSSLKDRADIYAKMVQNGIMTRAEARQLENLPPIVGSDELTAQINLAPLDKLGQIKGGSNVPEIPIAA